MRVTHPKSAPLHCLASRMSLRTYKDGRQLYHCRWCGTKRDKSRYTSGGLLLPALPLR